MHKNNLETLRDSIGRSSRVEDGTVVKFTKYYSNNYTAYVYVAMYLADQDKWYTTGRTQEMKVLTYGQMMNELAKAPHVEIVTDWKEV